MQAPRTLLKVATLLVLAPLFFACASTGLNNNLDTEVKGQNNRIVFSWSEDHPFANEYQRGRVSLISEYVQEDLNGNSTSVRQVISNAGRDFNDLNTKVFTLPPALRSIPSNTNICLYLALNNQAIPVRTSKNVSETARFSYPKWQQNVYAKTRNDFASNVISQAEQQLQLAIEAETQATNAKFDDLNRFNKLLELENNEGISKISTLEECEDIQIEQDVINKTKDIMNADFTRTAATAICTKASFWMLENYETRKRIHQREPNNFRDPATFEIAQVLPAMFYYINSLKKDDLFETEQFKPIAKIYQAFEKFATLTKHYYGSNKYYHPEGFTMHTSKYAHEAKQHDLFLSLVKGEIPSNVSEGQIREVVYNEHVEINNCIDDVTKHLNTKRQSYELNLLNAPKRALAATKYFVKSCKAKFEKREDVKQKFTQQRIDAEEQLAQLKARFQLTSDSDIGASGKAEMLNQNVCRVQ